MYKEQEEKILKEIIAKIRAKRKELKLSQNAFSETINVHREHLAKIETRKRNLTLKLLIRICIVHNIKLSELIDI